MEMKNDTTIDCRSYEALAGCTVVTWLSSSSVEFTSMIIKYVVLKCLSLFSAKITAFQMMDMPFLLMQDVLLSIEKINLVHQIIFKVP